MKHFASWLYIFGFILNEFGVSNSEDVQKTIAPPDDWIYRIPLYESPEVTSRVILTETVELRQVEFALNDELFWSGKMGYGPKTKTLVYSS